MIVIYYFLLLKQTETCQFDKKFCYVGDSVLVIKKDFF